MRGKVLTVPQKQEGDRITPAYAGKSEKNVTWFDTFEDHPRLCGEKTSCNSQFVYIIGSPPPMRGKVFRSSFNISFSRITPAYAGKSIKGMQFEMPI